MDFSCNHVAHDPSIAVIADEINLIPGISVFLLGQSGNMVLFCLFSDIILAWKGSVHACNAWLSSPLSWQDF
jgi:hypothetical protein